MRLIYLILICFAAPVAALIAWLRGLRDPSRRERLADRFGFPAIDGGHRTIWVHAASMGEVQAGAILVRELLKRHPEHRIVMTTMTATGAARVKSLFGSDFRNRVTHSFLPYDLPFAVRGFLDRVQPARALILETEMWPNLLRECVRRAIPVTIASARISPRTASRYRRLRSLFADLLASGVRIAAQTDADAERFKALGANDVRVTGNIKFDIEIPDAVRAAGAALRAQFGKRFVWVAGSTHPGEEDAALQAHRRLLEQHRDALLILVPRHPQRFEEVRQLLDKSGLSFVSRSSGEAADSVSVLLADTMGELLSFYAVADLAFVGGSLAPVGGHNLLEPASLGVATLCGPYMSNAQDVVDRFAVTNGVLQVSSAEALGEAVLKMANDFAARAELGASGRDVVEGNRGAVRRTLDLIDLR